MPTRDYYLVFVAVLALFLSACGSSDAPDLAEAGGVVTYKGQPLRGATVVFQPEEGPPATGQTADDGSFTLRTGAEAGAVLGPGKIAVTAIEKGASPNSEETGAAPSNGQAPADKWLIPEKYGRFETSGLTATVTDDPAKNKFSLDLTE